MKDVKKVTVAIVGLGFGKEFIPIYQQYPYVEKVAICARNSKTVSEIGDKFNIEANLRFTDFNELLKRDDIDAIHIVTPILEHAKQSIAALEAGKHTACTVPMATTLEELQALVKAKNKAKKVYMMMETALYTREYLYAKELVTSGKLGKIQFVRGSHMQNMGLEGWPEYWLGFPPMHYGTHAIAPLLSITDSMPEYVVCHGSGLISEDLAQRYGSPFAVETATFKLKNSNVVAEATRSLFETVRQYRESFDIYGDKMAFEWDQIEDEGAAIFAGGESASRIKVPDTDYLLPKEIASFTKRELIDDPNHVSFVQGAGHGGSHPHLVKEFIDSIIAGRDSAIDAVTSAYYTGAGICAHESAINGAVRVNIPEFEKL
ncbi:MAG: Gfo/Idh/MocA family oxidoreductase [Paenibacillaceae bacterium]